MGSAAGSRVQRKRISVRGPAGLEEPGASTVAVKISRPAGSCSLARSRERVVAFFSERPSKGAVLAAAIAGDPRGRRAIRSRDNVALVPRTKTGSIACSRPFPPPRVIPAVREARPTRAPEKLPSAVPRGVRDPIARPADAYRRRGNCDDNRPDRRAKRFVDRFSSFPAAGESTGGSRTRRMWVAAGTRREYSIGDDGDG